MQKEDDPSPQVGMDVRNVSMTVTQSQSPTQADKPAFEFNLITPFSSRINGRPAPVPYVIDGLLTQGGFSALAAKPKQGKSSLSRCEAVAVAKGSRFLGRPTTQGEVILVSLEDPLFHVDNCLEALGYDPTTDAPIHIIDRLPATADASIEALGTLLSQKPDVRLVIVDTLPKLIRVNDLNDYMPVLSAVEQLRGLARRFPHLHIQGVVHAKKVRTDDPFDALLGSTALRGEPDTSIAIYEEDRQRIIVTETRIGKAIPPTILQAELVDIAGADVVKGFSLHGSLDDYQTSKAEKQAMKQSVNYKAAIIAYLKTCDGLCATQEMTLQSVTGRRENLHSAITDLASAGVIAVSGKKHSPTEPLTLSLRESDALTTTDFMSKFGGR